MLTDAEFAGLVSEANLAPSVHNTQPTRWRRLPDGSVVVLEAAARRLAVGDPTGRDAEVSHGAAIEGFAIACAARGLMVEVTPLAGAPAALRPVARLTLRAGADPDAFHAAAATRRTYRGTFASTRAAAALDRLAAEPDLILVRAAGDIAALAALNDTASLNAYRDRHFRAELLSWMRLSRRHPNWATDGLNAEAMAMSPLTAAGAGLVLRPRVFEVLDRLGLAGALVAEAPVVRSAAAVALFHRPAEEAPLATGRRFHRAWLRMEALGLSAAPMAVLADDDAAAASIRRQFGIAPQRRLMTALRVGVAPEPRAVRPKARLAVGALLA